MNQSYRLEVEHAVAAMLECSHSLLTCQSSRLTTAIRNFFIRYMFTFLYDCYMKIICGKNY